MAFALSVEIQPIDVLVIFFVLPDLIPMTAQPLVIC